MGKLIIRLPGCHLLISSLPGSALSMHVESLGKPSMSTSILKVLPGKLDIKRHSPSILYLFGPNVKKNVRNFKSAPITAMLDILMVTLVFKHLFL